MTVVGHPFGGHRPPLQPACPIGGHRPPLQLWDMNVGITLFQRDNANIWDNGINQNIALLGLLLQKSPVVRKVWFVNGGTSDRPNPHLGFDNLGIPIVKPQEITHEIDVLIEMGAILPEEWMRRIHARGAKIVCFGVGHNYNAVAETVVFPLKQAGIHLTDPTLRTETWGLAHHAKTGSAMMRTLTRKPVVTMPHIWSPLFLDKTIQAVEREGKSFGFKPCQGEKRRWRVAIFEPNISVVKSYLVPMLLCEEAYRSNPEAVSYMMVMNTFHLKGHQTFLRFALNLDLTKDHKATYEPRVLFTTAMASHRMDAVVAHHWECGMNYAYYDALYGGYPLIHNSEFLQHAGVGIFYPGFSARKGARALVEARNQPLEYWQDYQRKAKEYLATLHPEHPENIRIFTERLLYVATAK
jgi:hypothetical protein